MGLVPHEVAQGLPGFEVGDVLRGDVRDVVEDREEVKSTRDMRREQEVGRIPKRAVLRKRLRRGDVERGAREMPTRKRRD